MRALWMAFGVLVALASSAGAQHRGQGRPEYKWCYLEPPYFMPDCRFDGIEQCRLEIPGLGGVCNLNPRYKDPPPRPAKSPKRRRGSV